MFRTNTCSSSGGQLS